MSVPATQAQELVARYQSQVDDLSLNLTGTSLRAILAEATRALGSARSHEERAALHALRGSTYCRLEQYADALGEFKIARVLMPDDAHHPNNIGACLIEMGQFPDGLDALRMAQLLGPTPTLAFAIALNECAALHGLKRTREARVAFEQAVALASTRSASHAFSLALVAAELGADHDAVELFARYLALVQGVELGDEDAVDFVRRAPDALWTRARALPVLHGALARVLAQQDDPAPEALQVRNRIVLAPEAIEKVDGLLEHPSAPTDALRRLMQA